MNDINFEKITNEKIQIYLDRKIKFQSIIDLSEDEQEKAWLSNAIIEMDKIIESFRLNLESLTQQG
jgi:hypothetical protein